MIAGLLLPCLGLGVLGWLVPRALARVAPEGVGPLLALAAIAALLMLALATGLFLLLYAGQGVPLPRLLGPDAAGLGHFLRLGLLSALVWGPVLLLSVAGLPARWTEATW